MIEGFIKLGAYQNVEKFMKKFQELGGHCSVTTESVSGSGEEEVWRATLEYLDNEGVEYSVSGSHPDKSTFSITK